jgi:hypothetical protein
MPRPDFRHRESVWNAYEVGTDTKAIAASTTYNVINVAKESELFYCYVLFDGAAAWANFSQFRYQFDGGTYLVIGKTTFEDADQANPNTLITPLVENVPGNLYSFVFRPGIRCNSSFLLEATFGVGAAGTFSWDWILSTYT